MNTMDIINTPGYFYSLAYWLSGFLVVCTNRKRNRDWKLWIVNIGFFLGLVSFMEYTDGIDVRFFMPCMVLDICMIFFYIYICCDFTKGNAGYYCARAFLTGEFIASLGWQLYYYGVNIRQVSYSRLSGILFLCIFYPLVFVLLFFLERRLQKGGSEVQINKRELITVVIITASAFTISNISYIYHNTPFSSRFNIEVFIIRTLVDLSGMAVLYAYHLQLKELQMKFEVDALQNILQMQYKNYQLSQESIDIVNQKYHDLKHQIILLKAEASTEKSLRYLEEIEQEIKVYEAQNKTGSKVLDAVLTSKTLYCQNNQITLTSVADGNAIAFMEDMDVSALFGNLLDNAIEGVEKLSDKEKKLIHLSVATHKNFLRIRVENYCEEKLKFKNGLPVTTKEDKRLHGFGLKSIQNTVKRYGGSVTAELCNNWFEIRILIPIGEGIYDRREKT